MDLLRNRISRALARLAQIHPLPAPVLVCAAEVAGMKNLSENFSRLHQARPWAIEKLIAVSEEHLPLLHGLQPRPQRMLGKRWQFASGTRHVEAARHQDDNLRLGFH